MQSILEIVGNSFTVIPKGYGDRWYTTKEHDSIIIDKQYNKFYWNSRNLRGNAEDWLVLVVGLQREVARQSLSVYSTEGLALPSEITTDVNVDGKPVVVYQKLVDVFHDNVNPEYWLKRGINESSINRFKLGTVGEWSTIPIMEDGIMRNFQCRRDNPKLIRSYYKSLHPYLFNPDILEYVKTIYITEGITDAILLNQYGLPVVSKNGGAGTWLPEWNVHFTKMDNIYLIYDNDDAGERGAKRVADSLGIYKCKCLTFRGKSNGYDMGNFVLDNKGITGDELVRYVKDNSRYSFE
jgi:hypothetical protein